MLINKISADNLVILPFDIYCTNCDHKMRKSMAVFKIDGATFAHETCPSLPLRQFSETRRIDTIGKENLVWFKR